MTIGAEVFEIRRVKIDGLGDAALSKAIRQALRAGEPVCALLLEGDFSPDVEDAKSFAAAIELLAGARLPVMAAATGGIGQRGLALLLAADAAVLSPDAKAAGTCRDFPGFAALAMRRLGPLAARRLAFADDPLALLCETGQAISAARPEREIERLAARLGTPERAARLRQSINAATELPFAEALEFDLWFERDTIGEKS